VLASVSSVINEVGLPAVVAALVSGGILGYFTLSRDREAARRGWLDTALRSFYGPVSAKLELILQTSEAMRLERERETMPRGVDAWQSAYELKLVQSNIKTQNEIAEIIESNLHYVVDPALRDAAISFLRDATLDQWRREAQGMEPLETGVVMFPNKAVGRPLFHNLVLKASEELGNEFRQLSGATRRSIRVGP
jgi:hypothetical protein